MTLAFQDIVWSVPVSKDAVTTERDGCDGCKTLLHGINGHVDPGQLLAVLGPSGAGKTTLLQLLSGRSALQPPTSLSQPSPRLTLAHQPLTKARRRHIAYVMQNDILLDNLTVQETLRYAALLKLPRSMTSAFKMAEADQLVTQLGLDKVRHSRVGSPQQRGVSGGELKRVNVGVELLSHPQVLVLDEPTTGLDSSTALALIQLLKRIALEKQCAVILSIHQPSTQVYTLLDQLLLLSNGRQVFFGHRTDALVRFAAAEIHCSPQYNPADFFLEALQQPELVYRMLDMQVGPNADASMQVASSKHGPAIDLDTSLYTTPNSVHASNVNPSPDESVDWPCPWGEQVWILVQRNFKQSRGRVLTRAALLQTLLVSVVVSTIWFQIPAKERFIDDWLGYYFFGSVYWCIQMLVPTAVSMLSERLIVRKERASGTYRLSAYLTAKLLSELPIILVLPSLYLALTYPITGIMVGEAGLVVWLTLLLSTAVAQSMGLFLGTIVDRPKTAAVLAGTLMSTSVVLGGFYVDRFPTGLGWLNYLSVVYYGYQGPLVYHFSLSTTTFECEANKVSPYRACRQAANGTRDIPGSDILDIYQIDTRLWTYYVGMLCMFVIFRLAAYITLKFDR